MKILLMCLLLSGSLFAENKKYKDNKVGGVISLSPAAKEKYKAGGTLFVFARSLGRAGGPPLAVYRGASPQFPHVFVLSPKNIMIPGTEWKGPFKIYARYNLSGNAMDKGNSLEGASLGKIMLGTRENEIILK